MNKGKITINRSRILSYHRFFEQLLIAAFLLSCLIIVSPAHAHRGAVDEIDACNIRVGVDSVHFTAYTPELSGSKGYCNAIPQVGQTHLVFDYGGKALRTIDVEFEITKEPEGTRIFYQEPQKVKTGSFSGIVDFSQYGAGNYLAHITIVDNDKQLDSHIPFSVGLEDPDSFNFMPLLFVFGLSAFVVLAFMYVSKDNDKPTDTPEA